MNPNVQQPLFDSVSSECISVAQCAEDLGVSSATIRNWIKTDYLDEVSKGQISTASVKQFGIQIIGKEKLNQRANKSRKESKTLQGDTSVFLNRLKECSESLDLLGVEYENSLSESFRNREGIYYTPPHIVNNLFAISPNELGTKTFCDPCCGSGNFLLRALDLGFKPENLYGYDTDPVAVEITKKRLLERTGVANQNIQHADFLHLAATGKTNLYDFIFTNPPWGKKIGKSEKESISRVLNAGTSLDTCSLFYFACLKALQKNGTLGLLLPDAFFNVAAYESARLSALAHELKILTHYGKPFKGLQTGAVGMVLTKTTTQSDGWVDCFYQGAHFQRKRQTLEKTPKSIFNINCTQEEQEVISHLYSLPYITLSGHADWGMGIVTGNNEKHISSNLKEDFIPVYKGSDIQENGLKPATHFISNDFSLYQQVAPLHLYQSPGKLIYKFISSNLCFYHDTDGRFIINSANLLIPHSTFPVSMKVLCDLLNSEFMNWVFKKIFNTHKVLRGDLELLPIHAQFLGSTEFSEPDYLTAIHIEKTGHGTFRIKK